MVNRELERREEVVAKIRERGIKFVNLQFCDLAGMAKSVSMPAEKFVESMGNGTWFDGSSIEGFARIFESDMYLKPDLGTFAQVPWVENGGKPVARVICDVYTPDGRPFMGDPRNVLKKILNEAAALGFEYKTGPELEFFLFKKESDFGGWRQGGIEPNDRGGYFDLTMDEGYAVREEMVQALLKMGVDVEASHHEVAAGQHEIDFKYDHALRSADRAMTLKYVLKSVAAKHGLHATFMPKPLNGVNGSGMHVHQSLFEVRTGQNIFYDQNDKYHLSTKAYNFIGGQLAHARGMAAVLCPLVNSYKRLVKGYEAPVYITWARQNRSALIRVPEIFKGKAKAARAEIRCPDPAANPYLAFAVLLKAGLAGMKQGVKAPEPVEEDVYSIKDRDLARRGIGTLPGSLAEAITELKKDEVLSEGLGKELEKRFIDLKRKEWDQYRQWVTDWEREKYLSVF